MIDRWGGEGVDFGKIGEIIRLLEWMMGGYQDDEGDVLLMHISKLIGVLKKKLKLKKHNFFLKENQLISRSNIKRIVIMKQISYSNSKKKRKKSLIYSNPIILKEKRNILGQYLIRRYSFFLSY